MLACIDIGQHHLTARQLSRQKFPKEILAAMLNEDTGELMEYHRLIRNPKYRELWTNSYGNELGRLAQEMPIRVKGTDTILFIHKNQVPADR